LDTAERTAIIPSLRVIARASPEDKFILVNHLRELGEVVASTGDGTNDAPQLKAADVGFSMGISGTDVAKEASDIILLDDNFASIVKAVMWGRNVYDSIRKFLQFQLTANIVAVSIAFIGAVSKGFTPLSAVQLLWVNLIMDTFAALALATEAPTTDLLKRPPHGRHASLITFKMWRLIIGQVLYQLGMMMTLLFAYSELGQLGILPRTKSTPATLEFIQGVQSTIIFNSFVFCQIFNEINCRKLEDELNMFSKFFNNHLFLVIMVFTIVVQVLLVQFSGEQWTQCYALLPQEWLVCLVLGALCLPLGFILRLIPVPNDRNRVKVSHLHGPLVEEDVTAIP